MPDKDKIDSAAAAKKAAEERKTRMEKRANEKKVVERARKIKAVRKAVEAKVAAEERNARMARRREERRKIEETKKKIMEAKEAAAAAKGETEEEVKPQEPVELIDFAVTARKYKTQLTKKYKERKFWVDPSPYEIVSYIPGTIISVDVKEKRVVKEGEQLLILEAMKMQNRVDMPFTARIKKINVKVGEKVPKDFVMIELEPAD